MEDEKPQRRGLALALEARREFFEVKQEEAVELLREIVTRLEQTDERIKARRLKLTVAGWRNWVKPRLLREADGIDTRWDPVLAEFLGIDIGELNYVRHGARTTPAEYAANKIERSLDGPAANDEAYVGVLARESALREAITLIRELEDLPATVNAIDLVDRLEILEADREGDSARLKRLEAGIKSLSGEVKRTVELVKRLPGLAEPGRRGHHRQTTS